MISSHCAWLVVVGGKNDGYKYIPHPDIAMVVELGMLIVYYRYL